MEVPPRQPLLQLANAESLRYTGANGDSAFAGVAPEGWLRR